MSVRRKISELLGELRILTPGSVSTRWRIIDIMLKLLLVKVEEGMEYRDSYLRPWEINAKVRRPTSVSNLIRMLVNFTPQILKPLDPRAVEWGPETHFTRDGVLILKHEVEIWNEIFKITDEYDFLKPLVQMFSQRLNEINRYV